MGAQQGTLYVKVKLCSSLVLSFRVLELYVSDFLFICKVL